jgi:hypothetical protein
MSPRTTTTPEGRRHASTHSATVWRAIDAGVRDCAAITAHTGIPMQAVIGALGALSQAGCIAKHARKRSEGPTLWTPVRPPWRAAVTGTTPPPPVAPLADRWPSDKASDYCTDGNGVMVLRRDWRRAGR